MKHAIPPYFINRIMRTCGTSLYSMDESLKEEDRQAWRWRLIKWIMLAALLLALLLSVSLYFFLGKTDEEIVVISDNLMNGQSTLYVSEGRTPSSQEFDSGELMDLEVSDSPSWGGERANDTFIDRLISSFQRSPTLGTLHLSPSQDSDAVSKGRAEGKTTAGLAVSPTLPSVPPRGHHPTTESPINHTEGVCRSPSISQCRGVVPWDLTSLPSVPGGPSLSSPSLLTQAMPYFEAVLNSACSPRAKHFLCPLLEPQCQPYGKPVTPPCRNVCKAVAEECGELILRSLDLSKVFECDLYPDSSDPLVCVDLTRGTRCQEGEVKCLVDGSCVPARWQCDGTPNCPRGTDELHCPDHCPPQQFRCERGEKCVPMEYRCDGHSDCPDKSDEVNCPQTRGYDGSVHSHASPCPSGELRCVDGRCIGLSQICDGHSDCSDAADESNCRNFRHS